MCTGVYSWSGGVYNNETFFEKLIKHNLRSSEQKQNRNTFNKGYIKIISVFLFHFLYSLNLNIAQF